MTSQPDSRLISSGVYYLLPPEQRKLLDTITLKKTITVDTVIHSIRNLLVSLSVEQDGTLATSSVGYLLPHCERKGCGNCRTTDRYVEVYPPKERMGDVTLVQHINYLGVTQLGNIRVRCHIQNLRDEVEVEDLEIAKERLAYNVLENRKVPVNLLVYCYLIQCRIRLTAENLTSMSVAGKSPERYKERYNCLKRRRQHDLLCKEATRAPYQVYTHELRVVQSVTSSVGNTSTPDPAYYLMVPTGGNAFLCLLRKSVRVITPEFVYSFVNGPGSTHVVPVSAEECRRDGIVGGYVRSSETWISTAERTEEERLYSKVVDYRPGSIPTPEQLVPDLRRRTGMSEALGVQELDVYDRIRAERKPKRVTQFSSSRDWDTRAIGRYLTLLFSYRMVVYRPKPK